jgi:hypothetical protein
MYKLIKKNDFLHDFHYQIVGWKVYDVLYQF